MSIVHIHTLQKLDVGGNINIKDGSSIYFDNHKVISADFFTLNLFAGGRSGVVVTGKNNTAFGNNALYSLTSGEGNTAIGTGALFSNNSNHILPRVIQHSLLTRVGTTSLPMGSMRFQIIQQGP